jgi:mannose-6-phosphate isomerase-like protein (cupin superfamily)
LTDYPIVSVAVETWRGAERKARGKEVMQAASPASADHHDAPCYVAAGRSPNLTELWSPRVVGEVDENYVKVAKVQGTFGWHSHEDEDELFLVLKGTLHRYGSRSNSI